MRLHVVSDVHGASRELADAASGADVFVCLGDLLLYLDYQDPSEGAFSEVFGRELTADYIELRLAKRFSEARALTASAWERMYGRDDPGLRMTVFSEIIDRQYRQIFNDMPAPALLTYGNVDLPDLWGKYLRPGHRVLNGESATIDGLRLGFVGGGLPSAYRTPNEVAVEEFDALVSAVGPVDVLFSHIPPAIPDLTYDVIANRLEVGSTALLKLIRETQPQYAVFGHVHQPQAARYRIGRTECINVGHFRATRRPFVVDVDALVSGDRTDKDR
ncbi:MAG: metallophosphoesterase family protein [Candidatus Nanopelagicales bacterium]|nr:metallophosphoesterase family protein [Candidatus Nanopelagicales bacterium]